MKTYSEIYRTLSNEVATVVFTKKDGTERVMLATKDLLTASVITGCSHVDLAYKLKRVDGKCSIGNGYISVIDLELADSRIINSKTIKEFYSHGEIVMKDQMERVMPKHNEYKNKNKDLGDLFDRL